VSARVRLPLDTEDHAALRVSRASTLANPYGGAIRGRSGERSLNSRILSHGTAGKIIFIIAG
jgi:hypothetical protein